MKKHFFALLILIISFGSFADEIFHCSSDIKTGIYKDNGIWKTGKFYQNPLKIILMLLLFWRVT